MPNPESPILHDWISRLDQTVQSINEQTYYIGHSVGCQAILRFLASQPDDTRIGCAIFVGGWFKLMNLEDGSAWAIAKPWLETPINFYKARKCIPQSVAILSNNDPRVRLESQNTFRDQVGSKII